MKPSPFQPPTLRADLPVYPQLTQLLRVTSTVISGPDGVAQFAGSSFLGPTLYVAYTQQMRSDSLLLRDREPCLVDDVNGAGLMPGYYEGRLMNSFSSLPVYAVAKDEVTGQTIDVVTNVCPIFGTDTAIYPGSWWLTYLTAMSNV